MWKVNWINGKYVGGNNGSVVVAVTMQRQGGQEILLIRSHDEEGLEQHVIQNVAVDFRVGSPHKIQGQNVGIHGEGEGKFQERRLKEMVVVDLEESKYQKLALNIQVSEYRYVNNFSFVLNRGFFKRSIIDIQVRTMTLKILPHLTFCYSIPTTPSRKKEIRRM